MFYSKDVRNSMVLRPDSRLIDHFCDTCSNLIVREVKKNPENDYIRVTCEDCGTVYRISQVRQYALKKKEALDMLQKD